MNWYLDRFVPVSSMVTFRVIILPWPMGNPSKCPIWSRGHCVLWSFYLSIGSAFSKPENIFELRQLPIRRLPDLDSKGEHGTLPNCSLTVASCLSSFLIFPAFRAYFSLNNMHREQIFQVCAWIYLNLECTSETPVAPPPSLLTVCQWMPNQGYLSMKPAQYTS